MNAPQSARLCYRPLTQQDVSEKYAQWLNDPEVNCYLETRFTPQSVESCSAFVDQMNADPMTHLFGMFNRASGEHIGNIKIGAINPVHSRGQLSLFIGEKSEWGKGLATEAVRAITDWGLNTLQLWRIEAGCYDENLGSLRAFLKAGYAVEGYMKQSVNFGHRRIGCFWMAILKGNERGA